MGGLPPGSMWIPMAVTFKITTSIGVTLEYPDKCINRHFAHMAHFDLFEMLRLSELFEEN